MRRALLLVVLLAWCASGCAATRVDPAGLPFFDARVETEDGWQVAVFHVPADPAAAGAPHYGTPVLMAHGTSVNRYNFMVEGSDLAAYLSKRGFDVWLAEYRGDRSSVPPSAKAWNDGAWTVDDIARYDLRAIAEHVRRSTGRDRLYWVGHSLGGILGYISLQDDTRGTFAGMVSISAPGDFAYANGAARGAFRHRGLVPKSGQVPSRQLGLGARPILAMQPDHPLLHLIFDVDNVDPTAMSGWVGLAMENIGRGVVGQYLRWIETGSIVSADGSRDYTAGLERIRVPTLFLAGRVDHIVPPWLVRAAYERVGSADKSYHLLGVGWGTEAEYGHGGPVAGDRAEQEVFPLIGDWLVARAAGSTSAPTLTAPPPAPEASPPAATSPWGASAER